jgi:hypothetical protein
MFKKIVAWFRAYQQRRKDAELMTAMQRVLADCPRIAEMYRKG